MPANLSPEYYEAEQSYRRAATDRERLAALQEMLSAIPKHKGTEKMQADLKSRIAKLKSEVKSGGGKARRYDPSHVKSDGAGQVVLVGAPNSGKSALVAAVTNARPEVAPYPYTTQAPQPAMMPFENVQIQLVDAPAISREYTPAWLSNLVRYADAALLVADAGNDACLENVEAVVELLLEKNVRLVNRRDADVSVLDRVAEVPALLFATKMDRPGAGERVEILREFFGDRFEILSGSTERPETLDALRRRLFERLEVIRVCTKAPGKPPETEKPFVLPAGSTVVDLARHIHKDLVQKMQFARIWGTGKFDGQRVPRDHALSDMDIVEIQS
jgi:ribosome-interacting GTPase 1